MKNLVVFLALFGATTAATAPSVRAQGSSAGAQQPPTLASVLSMQYFRSSQRASRLPVLAPGIRWIIMVRWSNTCG